MMLAGEWATPDQSGWTRDSVEEVHNSKEYVQLGIVGSSHDREIPVFLSVWAVQTWTDAGGGDVSGAVNTMAMILPKLEASLDDLVLDSVLARFPVFDVFDATFISHRTVICLLLHDRNGEPYVIVSDEEDVARDMGLLDE